MLVGWVSYFDIWVLRWSRDLIGRLKSQLEEAFGGEGQASSVEELAKKFLVGRGRCSTSQSRKTPGGWVRGGGLVVWGFSGEGREHRGFFVWGGNSQPFSIRKFSKSYVSCHVAQTFSEMIWKLFDITWSLIFSLDIFVIFFV